MSDDLIERERVEESGKRPRYYSETNYEKSVVLRCEEVTPHAPKLKFILSLTKAIRRSSL